MQNDDKSKDSKPIEPDEGIDTTSESEPIGEVHSSSAREELVEDTDARGSIESNVPTVAAESVEDVDADVDVRREMSRMTRRSFFWAAVAAGAGYGGWSWLNSRSEIDRLAWPYRRMLDTNQKIAEAYFSPRHRIHEWPLSKRDPKPRVNGHFGLDGQADHTNWKLRIEGLESGLPVELTIDDIRRLPRYDMVTEFRCIEGWNMFVHWTGVRLADLMRLHPPASRDGSLSDPAGHPERLVRYVSMETPGRGYYVGLDMASAMHPQTLLAYEINGQPLSWHHGAPLRLAIPVKYGIKNIKRIALIRYTDTKPPDFWGDRKYDWYAGL